MRSEIEGTIYRDGLDAAMKQIRQGSSTYSDADPFPHGVFEGLFDEDFLDSVLSEFPDPGGMSSQFDDANQRKSAESRWETFGPATKRLMAELNSEPLVDALEELTGIEGVICDHHLLGGGQHQIKSGGLLGVHADFNRHKRLQLDRRLNLLLYLNRDWQDEWGGHLELWDTSMTKMVKKIRPSFNTLVVFSTNSDSFHGHPDPLATPPHITRRSIATYYYTNGRDDGAARAEHSTLFKDRPSSQPAASRGQKAMSHFKAGALALLPESAERRLRRR